VPHCQQQFELSETLAQPILEAERARIAIDAKRRTDELNRREEELRDPG